MPNLAKCQFMKNSFAKPTGKSSCVTAKRRTARDVANPTLALAPYSLSYPLERTRVYHLPDRTGVPSRRDQGIPLWTGLGGTLVDRYTGVKTLPSRFLRNAGGNENPEIAENFIYSNYRFFLQICKPLY